jgi:hypothetical protein
VAEKNCDHHVSALFVQRGDRQGSFGTQPDGVLGQRRPLLPRVYTGSDACSSCSTYMDDNFSTAIMARKVKLYKPLAHAPAQALKGERHNRWGSLEPWCCAPARAFLRIFAKIGSGSAALNRFRSVVQWHMQHQGLMKPAMAQVHCEATGLKKQKSGLKAHVNDI